MCYTFLWCLNTNIAAILIYANRPSKTSPILYTNLPGSMDICQHPAGCSGLKMLLTLDQFFSAWPSCLTRRQPFLTCCGPQKWTTCSCNYKLVSVRRIGSRWQNNETLMGLFRPRFWRRNRLGAGPKNRRSRQNRLGPLNLCSDNSGKRPPPSNQAGRNMEAKKSDESFLEFEAEFFFSPLH